MDVYREELRLVTEELVYIRDQVRDLLDRQTTLQGKKSELEAILKQSTAKPRHGDEQQFDRTDFAWSGDLEAKLTSVFGIRALRPLQLRTMNVTLSGKDCMLIMPTGGGKSLCFQLPALLSKGVTLVVSPLISLMEDQLMALKALGVPAAMLSASATPAEVKQVQEDMLDNNAELKALYVTPEKLAKSKRFMAKLEKMYELGRFARLVIDEVHCCSQWGHDFRPDYKFLGIMKRQFPEVPILGLTATATISVLRDVQTILNLPAESSYLFRSSFNRANLYYEVRHKPATSEKVLEEIVGLLKTDFKGQSGIIYCFSKKEAEELHLELTKKRIESGCYHADCTAKDRSKTHQMWTANKLQVMVATVAFGMGIDKPDVRFVIHHSISKSMENLYQESGRAGRDDQPSRCIVYYRLADVFRQSSMVFTEQTGLDNLMGLVEYCTDTHRCRRSMIARHFGEVWESSHCNGMCDHCDPMKKVVADTIDVTRLCSAVITILDHAADQTQRITANMLIDTWQGKGKKPMKDSGAPVTSLSREECELVIAVMLQQAYVREDFHFTPYSTISYLVPGTKAVTLRHHSASVHIKVSPQTFSSLPRVDPADVVLQKEKPKTTAHFSSSVHIDLTGNTADVKLEDTRKPAKKGDDKSVKKGEEKSVKKAEEKATKKGAKSEEKSSLKRGGGDRPEVNHLDFCDYLAGSPPQTPTLVEGKSPAKKRKS